VPASGGRFTLQKDPRTGDCVFSGGGSCRIQSDFGYDAKPLACRVFPLEIRRWKDGRISAAYRWVCPEVGDPEGALLENEGSLETLARELDDVRPADDVFSDRSPADLFRVRKIHAGFSAILHAPDIPLKLRLYALARTLDFHDRKEMAGFITSADDSFAADACDFLLKAEPVLRKELAAARRPDALLRTMFRNHLCSLLQHEEPGLGKGFSGRLSASISRFRIALGTGSIRRMNPAAPGLPGSFFPVQEAFPAEPDAVRIHGEFLFGKFDGMDFWGRRVHGYTYCEGLRHLLAAGVQIRHLAAAFALSADRPTVSGENMLHAVQLADLSFANSSVFRLKSARKWVRFLTTPRNMVILLRVLPEK